MILCSMQLGKLPSVIPLSFDAGVWSGGFGMDLASGALRLGLWFRAWLTPWPAVPSRVTPRASLGFLPSSALVNSPRVAVELGFGLLQVLGQKLIPRRNCRRNCGPLPVLSFQCVVAVYHQVLRDAGGLQLSSSRFHLCISHSLIANLSFDPLGFYPIGAGADRFAPVCGSRTTWPIGPGVRRLPEVRKL